MYYWLFPLIAGLVLLGVFLYFRAREQRKIAVVIKGFVSLMFIATALVAWLTAKSSNPTFRIFVIVGLFFGLLGDIFLDIKFISKHEFLFTALGFITFGIGHIFYSLGLFVNFFDFDSQAMYLLIPAGVTLILLSVTVLMERFSAVRYGKMKPFVIGYGIILFFTVALYMTTAILYHFNVATLSIMAVALISFMLSDLVLNNTYFAPNCNTPVYIISNHILYYFAQFAIAVSLFFVA